MNEVLEAKEKLEKMNILSSVPHTIDIQLQKALETMRKNGVLVNMDRLTILELRVREEKQAVESRIYLHAGRSFNINSTDELRQVIFSDLLLKPHFFTPVLSTERRVLESIGHPICHEIITYRELVNVQQTISRLKDAVDSLTGRIICNFECTVTDRITTSRPNLQTIANSEWGRKVRKCIIAPKGHLLASFDYAQIELVALAYLSDDKRLKSAIRYGKDVHILTASKLFGVSDVAVTPEMRQKAKEVNFTVLYGGSALRLAQKLDISVLEVNRFIKKFYTEYAGVRRWKEETIANARSSEQVEMLSGKVRELKFINSADRSERQEEERKAVNTSVQALAAYILQRGLISIQNWISEQGSHAKILFPIHDELLISIPEQELKTTVPIIKQLMEGAFKLSVPLSVSVKVGPNWGEMISYTSSFS